jgi:hypothetical protein
MDLKMTVFGYFYYSCYQQIIENNAGGLKEENPTTQALLIIWLLLTGLCMSVLFVISQNYFDVNGWLIEHWPTDSQSTRSMFNRHASPAVLGMILSSLLTYICFKRREQRILQPFSKREVETRPGTAFLTAIFFFFSYGIGRLTGWPDYVMLLVNLGILSALDIRFRILGYY